MVLQDLSTAVFDALDAALPNEGRHVVQRVKVSEGWGEIHHVHVFSGIRYLEAGVGLEEAIRTIVAGVMRGRRHVVRIVWAELT